MKKILKESWGLIVALAFVAFYWLYQISLETDSRKLFKLKLLLIVFLAMIVVYFFWEKKIKWELHKVFLVTYLVLGMFYMIALPMFVVPDEPNHFLRGYEISQGKFLAKAEEGNAKGQTASVGDYLPENLIPDSLKKNANAQKLRDIKASIYEEIDKENYRFYEFANTALYAPTSYLPQSIGMGVADIFTDNVLCIAYAGRIANWLIIAFVLYQAMKLLPFGKKILFLIALLPINMQEVVSLAPDGQIVALAALFVAVILHVRYSEIETMSKKYIFMIYALIILICLCKIVYAPLCLLLFLIPRKKFGTIKKYRMHISLAAICIAVFSFGWLMITSQYFVEFQEGVNIVGQFKNICKDPLDYINVLFRTVDMFGNAITMGMFGSLLGWLNIDIGFTLFVLYFLLLIYTITMQDDGIRFKDYGVIRAYFGIVSLIVAGAICTALYMQWTKLDELFILGIQGRYFVPLLLMVLLAVKPLDRPVQTEKSQPYKGYFMAVVINLCVLIVLFKAAT